MSPFILMLILVCIALGFDYVNGFHDAANIVATLIASGAATPRVAIPLVALCHFIGPLLIGTAVATTIGTGIVSPESITIPVIITALLAAIIWNLITWYFGLPSSSSHALVGGMVGAVWVAVGFSYIHIAGLVKILGFLFGSLLVGTLSGYMAMMAVRFFARGASPKANVFFKNIQIPVAIALGLSHGSNDAQKTMGIITMALVILGFQQEFVVPLWVVLACSSAIAIGTATGGWRIIRTVGRGIFRVRPVHAFTAQSCSAVIIFVSSLMGGPVSTTNVVSSTIMGVGSAERISAVRWGMARNIILAWVVTLPIVAALAALLYKLISLVML